MGNEELFLNEKKLQKLEGSSWDLPQNAPIGIPLSLQIQRNGEFLSKTVVELVEPTIKILPSNEMLKRDREGNSTAEETQHYVTGASVFGENGKTVSPRIQITSLPGTLILVGREAGQIARWPKEPFPTAWTPVWAIRRIARKKWQAQFCGQEISQGTSPMESDTYSIKRRKEWREALWIMRQRALPPQLPELSQLWTRYTEVAQDI